MVSGALPGHFRKPLDNNIIGKSIPRCYVYYDMAAPIKNRSKYNSLRKVRELATVDLLQRHKRDFCADIGGSWSRNRRVNISSTNTAASARRSPLAEAPQYFLPTYLQRSLLYHSPTPPFKLFKEKNNNLTTQFSDFSNGCLW